MKEYTASSEYLEKAVALRPEYADIHCQLGIAMLALGEFNKAKTEFEGAVEISGSYAKARYMLGMALHALGDNDAANIQLKESLDLDPDLFPAEFDVGVRETAVSDCVKKVRNVAVGILGLRFHSNVDRSIPFAEHLNLAATAQIHLAFRTVELNSAIGVMRVVGRPKSLLIN